MELLGKWLKISLVSGNGNFAASTLEIKQILSKKKVSVYALKGANIIRSNPEAKRPCTLIGDTKCIYTSLNGPRIEPIHMLIIRIWPC